MENSLPPVDRRRVLAASLMAASGLACTDQVLAKAAAKT
jgi:beta-galactosidase